MWAGEHRRVGLFNKRGEPEVLGVIGNDKEIKRAFQLSHLIGRGDDGLAVGESVGVSGPIFFPAIPASDE